MASAPQGDGQAELREKYFHDKRVEFETGCSAGDAGACFALGEWWLHFAKDPAKAEELFKSTCYERKHGNSCFSLAQLYQGGRAGTDSADEARKAKTFELNSLACEYKNFQGCGMAGMCRMYGFGCEKDIEKAKELMSAACEENDANSCFRLGRIYLDGEKKHGVARDASVAFRHMLKACQLGHPNGCQVVSVMYKKGDGVAQDEKRHEFYRERTMDIIRQTGERIGANVVM